MIGDGLEFNTHSNGFNIIDHVNTTWKPTYFGQICPIIFLLPIVFLLSATLLLSGLYQNHNNFKVNALSYQKIFIHFR